MARGPCRSPRLSRACVSSPLGWYGFATARERQIAERRIVYLFVHIVRVRNESKTPSVEGHANTLFFRVTLQLRFIMLLLSSARGKK